LSGAPLTTVHETCAEVNTHLEQVRAVTSEIGAGVVGLGFAPTWSMEETHQMPKGRYAIMRRYMPKVGGYGHEMMFRTCTVQVNLDFSSEADMVKKFRVGLALQPVATALFANSPFREGKPIDFLSYRSHVWTDVDNARSGMLPWVFEDGMSFERYVDYALDVPMYFVYEGGRYVDVAGKSFRDFLTHQIPEVKHVTPTIAHWADHLTTIFPEVRLKKFLEMRGADGGQWRRICGLPALWVGIYYDQIALDAAWDLVKDWTAEERQAMRDSVPRLAFRTPFRGGTVLDLAKRMLEISAEGLRRRAAEDSSGMNEEGFLVPLRDLVARGYTRAEELLRNYKTTWNHDLTRLFAEYNFL
jgi:glutamate--cysteine ligase